MTLTLPASFISTFAAKSRPDGTTSTVPTFRNALEKSMLENAGSALSSEITTPLSGPRAIWNTSWRLVERAQQIVDLEFEQHLVEPAEPDAVIVLPDRH